MQFVDQAQIFVKAGDGGNGCVAFRREAHTPHGGPSGGDGGDGGSVIIVATPQLNTLLDFRFKRHHKAQRGEDGRGKDQYGKAGEDLILKVPIGTQLFNAETGELIADLDAEGEQIVIAEGGKGGMGNMHFAKPWNQAPRTATPGTVGAELDLRMELKLIADCGLLGYPSVGKSTFIASVSRAKPKIADYPFTTLVPNLGVSRLPGERTLVIADIPGLIEGASDGAGLGHQFLRHVERTRALLHILECTVFTGPDRNPIKDYDTLNRELARYAPHLAEIPQVVALNKGDLEETREAYPALKAEFKERGVELHLISAASQDGVREILEELWKLIHPAKK